MNIKFIHLNNGSIAFYDSFVKSTELAPIKPSPGFEPPTLVANECNTPTEQCPQLQRVSFFIDNSYRPGP
jgi:hypothetical protein